MNFDMINDKILEKYYTFNNWGNFVEARTKTFFSIKSIDILFETMRKKGYVFRVKHNSIFMTIFLFEKR